MTALDIPGTDALRRWVADHTPAMLEDLGDYVRVETPSDDLAALAAGRDWVVSFAERRLGAPAAIRTEPGGPYGDTVVLDHEGTGDGTLVLLAHYDTVWPLGTLAELPVQCGRRRDPRAGRVRHEGRPGPGGLGDPRRYATPGWTCRRSGSS